MKLAELIDFFETVAPSALQEDYDNSGLIVGNKNTEVQKALLCLDSTEEMVDEAIREGCDVIIAHHPIVFRGLKRFNGNNYVERTVIKAIQNNIAIYACHTNLDNVLKNGVNAKIAEKLGLKNCSILSPKKGQLLKLAVYVPDAHAEAVRNALFAAGAGKIGEYDECSFNLQGEGTFRGSESANPYVGEKGIRHTEHETKVEMVLPEYALNQTLQAMFLAHPYEEVAYDTHRLMNPSLDIGSGLIGELHKKHTPDEFLALVKQNMGAKVIRFTETKHDFIEKVAVCGGSGSFLIGNAMAAGAQAYLTADVKYHEFFDAEKTMMICDMGHYESEKYTIDLFGSLLSDKFPNFATIFSSTQTNPINYYY